MRYDKGRQATKEKMINRSSELITVIEAKNIFDAKIKLRENLLPNENHTFYDYSAPTIYNGYKEQKRHFSIRRLGHYIQIHF